MGKMKWIRRSVHRRDAEQTFLNADDSNVSVSEGISPGFAAFC
jgi:hypothetical protein